MRTIVSSALILGLMFPASASAATALSSTRLEALSFSNASTGYIVGGYQPSFGVNNGVVARTTDGGDTWRSTVVPGKWFFGVGSSEDGASATAVVGYTDDRLWQTTNTGASWTQVAPVLSKTAGYSDAAYLSGGRVLVGAWNSYATIASLSGPSWQQVFFGPIYPPPSEEDPAPTTKARFAAVDALPGGTTAWAVGNDWTSGSNKIMVYKTSDAGSDWSQQYITTSALGTSVAAASATHLFVGRRNGYVLFSQNGGTNWSQDYVGSGLYVNAIDAFDANNVVLVGDSGKIYKSTNAADGVNANWTLVSSGTTNHLRGVHMFSANSWIVIGDNETIRRTTNGGTSWTGPVALTKPSVAITSPSAGFSVGSTTINVAGTATDGSGIGVAQAQVQIKRRDGTYWNDVSNTWTTDGTLAATWVDVSSSNGWATWNGSVTIDSVNSASQGITVNARSRDGMGLYSDTKSVQSDGYAVNGAPVLTPIGNKTVAEGATLSFQVAATDPDGDPLVFSASNLPSGATFSASTRTFTFKPSFTQAGTYSNVTFKASDGQVESSTAISITVTNVNRAPVAANQSLTTAQNTPLAIMLSGTDADGDALTYTMLSNPTKGWFPSYGALPSLTYNPEWNITGDDSFTFRVSDGKGGTSIGTVSVSIKAMPTTKVALSSTSLTTGYGAYATVRGTLKKATSPTDALPVGTPIVIKRGTTVVKTAYLGTGGAFSFYFRPSNVATVYTVEYAGSNAYLGSKASVKITPKASIGKPYASKSVKRYRSFYPYAYIWPKHASKAGGTRFLLYKYKKKSNGKYAYVYVKSVAASTINSTSYPTKSKVKVKLRLSAGKYRMRVKHADSGHAKTYSAYKYFRVY